MANSFVRYTGDGSTVTYAIPFSYIDETHLQVVVNGVSATFSLDLAGTSLTLDVAPALDDAIELRRDSSQDTRLTDYESGSVLTEKDLDTDSLQAFYTGQEAIDIASDTIQVDNTDFKFNANNKAIKNVADPTADTDAVTKGYLENTWLSTGDKSNLTTTAGISSSISTLANISTDITGLNQVASDIGSVGGVSTEIGQIAPHIADVTTVAGDIADVSTVAGKIAKVEIVSDDITAVNDVANKIQKVKTVADDLNEPVSEIHTVATSITNVDNVGANIQDVLDVSTSITDVNDVANGLTNISTVASNISAVNQAGSNISAITNVNANQTNINAVASDSANIASVGANINNINTVASDTTAINNINTNMASVNTVATNMSDVITVANDLNEAVAEIDTVANSITNVDLVGNNMATVTTVAGATTNINNVGNNITSVNNVNSNMTSLTTVAGDITDVSTVAGAIVNVNNVGGAITNVNDVANKLTEITDVSQVLPNITTNANNVTDIQSVATNISNVVAVAGNQTNINAVNTNSTNINTVASSIADVNRYADEYVISSSEPSSPSAGDLWYDSTDTKLKYYDGNIWHKMSSAISTVRNDYKFIATNNQTVFTGSDTNGNTLAFNDEAVTVFLNGTRLDKSDYTLSNDDTITFSTGLSTGEELTIESLGNLQLADAQITAVSNNSANITTVATNMSSVVTASTLNQTHLATVAGDTTEINTLAGISGNITTVAGIGSSTLASVVAMASDITTVNANATNINLVAGDISNVNAYFDQYKVSATAPSSPTVGDLWFDTSLNLMKVYSANGFIEAGSSINGTSRRYVFTPSTSTTTFTGGDVNGNSLAYDAGFADIYLNGVKLAPADFTATTGTNIVLGSAITSGDTLEVIAYGTFELANINANDITTGTIGLGRLPTITNAKLTNDKITINGDDVSLGDSITVGRVWESKTNDFTAEVGKAYFIDTTSNTVDATLPSSPSQGDEIRFLDVAGNADVNNITINRNGHKIQADASDMTVDTERAGFSLVYFNATQGWLLMER